MPLPEPLTADGSATAAPDLRGLPGGVSNTTHGEGVVRGVGYAVGVQERRLLRGFRRLLDRPGPARDHRRRAGGDRAHRRGRGGPGPGHHRAADLPHRAGRGAGPDPPGGHRRSAPAGSTSASRQTYMTGGAVKAACERVARAGARPGPAAARPHRGRPAAGGREGGQRRRGPAGLDRRRGPRRDHRGNRASGGTGPRTRSTRRPGRASRTCSTRSRRTARWSTSTPTSAWSRSSSWPAPRTSARP